MFTSATYAMALGAAALGLGRGCEVLTPSMTYGSEGAPLWSGGAAPRTFRVRDDLQPDEDELDGLVTSRTRALHLVHFLGFPQDSLRWRRWCDERGLLLIESTSSSWLGNSGPAPPGASADLGFFCFGQTLGVAGTVAVVRAGELAALDEHHLALRHLLSAHLGWAAQRSARFAALEKRFHRSPERSRHFDQPSLWSPPRAVPDLLMRLADPAAAARRRAHHQILADELSDLVVAPFSSAPVDSCPLYFPIDVPHAGVVARRLASCGIEALLLDPPVHDGRLGDDGDGDAGVLGLPVHQELRPSDIDRIIDAFSVRRPARARVEIHHRLEPLRKEWDLLATRAGNLFGTWEWTSSWWDNLGQGKQLQVLVVRDGGGALLGLVPLYWAAGPPVGLLRFVGHDAGDQLGPICAPEHRAAVAAATNNALARISGWKMLVGEQLPLSEGWPALLDGRSVRREASPVASFASIDDWDSFLATRSANLRQQVRRRERNLHRRFDVTFRLALDPGTLDEDLTTLFRLHEARWGHGGAFAGPRERLHRTFAHQALERGWLRFWLLHLDGRPAAAWYGFRYGGEEWYYQSGRDPHFDEANAGFVLFAHTMREALHDGATAYRMLRGDEPYKFRFATSDPGLETMAVGAGFGRVAARAAVASGRLPPEYRRLLRSIVPGR